jgi:hypothetical protein
MENRVFVPQESLDQWNVDGAVDLQGSELTIVAEGRRYKLVEAVHVLREVSGTGDGRELVGRVKTRDYLEEIGAELVETSMLLGEAAYDVDPGWLGTPIGTFSEYVGSDARKSARAGRRGAAGSAKAPPGEPRTDEDLLARFLEKNL